MNIDTRKIPPGGRLVEGREETDIFQLTEQSVRAVSPLRYKLTARLQQSELLLEGAIEAQFEFRCVRCLEFFPKTVRIAPYTLVYHVKKPGIQDLTECLREDILLDLPGYPRCDQADSPRKCPAGGSFSSESADKRMDTPENERDVWNALDNLDTQSDEPSSDT